MPDRFVVTAISGWEIRPGPGRQTPSRAARTSYSVIDTVACCREVGRFYASFPTSDARRLAEAEAFCAKLNATDARYERAHVE